MTIRRRSLYSLAWLGAGFGLAASNLPLDLPSTCFFHRVTGLPCCMCGMTHAFCALAHGHIHDAIAFHLASVPLAAMVAAAGALLAAEVVVDRPVLRPVWKRAGRWVVYAWLPILFLGWAINLTHALSG